MIFKTLNGDLTVFNKTLISTKEHLKALETVNATVYNKNGAFYLQGLLVNSSQPISVFTKLNNAFNAYNGNLSKSTQLQNAYVQAVGKQNTSLGNYLASLNGAKASMGGYIKYLAAAKAASIGLQVTSVALNAAISTGITLTINALISQISKWIHAQEEARQKAIALTNSYKEQRDSLDLQTEKYKELKEALDNGNLSTDETRSVKEQLLEIQKSLIESYGNEASNIDLVNGKYREQLGLLSELSKEKATDYVTENRDVFADAKKALEKIRTYNLGTVSSWNDYAPETEDQKKLIEYLETYSDLLDLTYQEVSGGGVSVTSVNLSVKADVENADELMHQLAVDLEQYGKDNNIDVSGLLEGISRQLKQTWTDELTEYKTVYDEFMKAEVVRNNTLRPLYQQSIQAVEDYNEALLSGEGVAEAKTNLDAVQQSVQIATSELEGSQEVFDSIYDGINKNAESAYDLAQSFENNGSVKGYAEQLRGLTDIDLQSINFEDSVQGSGEEAFGALIDILGLSEDEVQNLIDKLVELGYVQEEVQSSTPNFEPPTPLTITQTVDQISTRLKSAFGSLQSAYQEIFTRNEETGEKIFASLDEVDITDKFQPILDALQDLDELDGINVDYSSYEDFVSVLSDTSSTAEEVQEQFDRLATDIIYTSDCTSMSAETFNLLAESLSEMGVSNAYEALNSILTLQQALADEGVNVQTAMSGETEKLKDLTFASDETAERLMAYYIQKQLAQNPLGTLDDILQLESLCNALGITGEMLETVTALKLAFEAKESGAHAAGLDESMKAYQEKLAGLASGYGTFSFDFNAADTKSSSTSGSTSSAKAAAETFDWVSQAIEHVEKEIEELDDTANSSYSTFSEKNEAFAQEIRKVSDEIGLQQQAYENYIQKADAVGLSDHYRDLVENGASVMEDISDEALKNQISEYQKWYDKAQETQNKINSLYEKSKDIHVASYENCVQELDTLRDNDSISEREYLDRMSMLWETYYADQTEYAAQAKEAKLELLKREKSYLESVADAASNLLNGQAEELRNRQEAEIEVLEAKKRPLEAQLELLEAQEEKEDRILALQKAQYELKRAEHQRDKLTYVDGQMVYRADEAGIRNAKDAVDDAEYNIVKGNIQDRIDAYDKEIDKVKERYETEIAGIERLENEWQKALALRENALTAGDFESMFGEGSIEKLLSGNSSMISTWRQAYLEALGGIDFTANGTIGEMTARYAELAGLDLSSITEQTMTVASQFHAIHDAVGRLNASIASEPATDTPDGTSAKQTQSSEDSLSLSGALQNTYDIASEVLPEEAEMLHTIAEAANTAAATIHELKTAIASLSALPLSPDSLTISGNAYASGTRRAQKGLAVIGEEKPEMIITNGQKAFLAKQPTLLRMEGGETVYSGEETERMLKARGFQPVTPDKFPLLKAFASYRPSEIRQHFVPQMINPANTAAASAIQNAGRAVNNSFNNGTSFTTGDVHIHCPGITKDEVAKQIGTELTNVFSGMSLNAYQHVNITR